MSAGAVTVGIPVLNGERYLDEVLRAVRAQRVDRELELLVVDSGSTDRSLEIAREHGATLHEIPKSSFSHGATRNWMMQIARGDHVAFITQDATPAHERWLAGLLECFDAAADVALAWGPHRPRLDASHVVKAEAWRWFRNWEREGPGIHVQHLDRDDPEALADYQRMAWKLQFFSDVNGCVARWAWERIPYRPVPYAEDQLLAREMIEAGFRKAYNPEAAVLHSHDYPPGEFFRRYFDEWRSLREVLGHVEPVGPRKTPQDIWYLVKADRAYLREVERRSKPASLVPMAKSARHHALRISAAALGSRADALPKGVRRALSLEGRDSFVTYELPESPLAPGNGDGRRPAAPVTSAESEWEFDFVRRAFPRRPLLLEPARDLAAKESLKIAWVVPAWTRGSGGHMTIFRLIQMLERRGHECSIHVFDPRHYDPRPAHELAASVRDEFLKLEAPVLKGLDDWAGADVGVATNWWTAYPLRDLPFCAEKVYLVQDFEPDFYARSAEHLWAEETYRMGYRAIAYTPWMAEILRERYGMEAAPFDCGTDLLTYQLGADASRDPATIAVYARQETERRAVQLSLAALGTLKARRPEVEVVAFGTDRRLRAPLELHNIGIAPPAALAALYQRATAGLCLSLTTHSLVAQEMMASGLPVVELEGDNVSSALGESGRLAMLAEPTPDSIADALERVLDDRAAAAAMAARARAFVEERTWERAGDQVEAALRDYLARPRARAAVKQ